MPNGGVIRIGCENVEVTPETVLKIPPGPYVVATVHDRGCGIPTELMDRIFEPYFTTKDQGSGLGLATCYTAVHRHGGTITVRSKVNVGTEFQIYLPASGKAAEPVNVEAPRVIPGDGSVLVVDDQDGVREVAMQIPAKTGLRPHSGNRRRRSLAPLHEAHAQRRTGRRRPHGPNLARWNERRRDLARNPPARPQRAFHRHQRIFWRRFGERIARTRLQSGFCRNRFTAEALSAALQAALTA